MISGVNKVGLPVSNQDKARTFWTETMGFELVKDVPYDMSDPDGPRWIEVTPPEQNVTLVLSARRDGQPSSAGTLAHVLFHCVDIKETYELLTRRGVEFTQEPLEQFWGWSAMFKDQEGTLYVLNQR